MFLLFVYWEDGVLDIVFVAITLDYDYFLFFWLLTPSSYCYIFFGFSSPSLFILQQQKVTVALMFMFWRPKPMRMIWSGRVASRVPGHSVPGSCAEERWDIEAKLHRWVVDGGSFFHFGRKTMKNKRRSSRTYQFIALISLWFDGLDLSQPGWLSWIWLGSATSHSRGHVVDWNPCLGSSSNIKIISFWTTEKNSLFDIDILKLNGQITVCRIPIFLPPSQQLSLKVCAAMPA